MLNPSRTVSELRALRELTGDERGAHREAFTPAWVAARDFLKSKLAALPVETREDAAGNLWSTLPGRSPKALLIGGHMDSVPYGGWLDGCLNTLAGVEILRRITLDQRHLEAPALAAMLAEARSAAERFAHEAGVDVRWEPLCRVAPAKFDEALIGLCDEAITETCGTIHRMPSGPLHDATSVARAGIPTAMMFVQSLHGISHNRIEDTKVEHIEAAVRALDRLATKAIARIARTG